MSIAARLASPDPEERRLAAQALREADEAAAPSLLALALADEDWRVRKEAALSAGLAPRRTEVLKELLAALGNRDSVGLRNAAVEALVAVGPDAVPTAIRALRTLDADGRKLAVEALGGVPDLRGAEALAATLDDPDVNVRQAAVEALGTSSLAGDAARAVAVRALRGVLSTGEPVLRLAALGALLRLDVALDWAQLAPLLADPVLRGAALEAATRCLDPRAGEAMVPLLFDPHQGRVALVSLAQWVHLASRHGLPVDRVAAELQAKNAGAQVRALGQDGTPTLQGAALTLLALLGDAEAAPAIVRALLDPMLARAAETAATWLGTAALPALLAVGEREPPGRHAELLLLVPTLASHLDDRSLAVVRATLAHPADEVMAAAAQVLGVLGDGSDIERLASVATAPAPGRAASSAAVAIEALAERWPDEALALFERIEHEPDKALAACVLLRALHGAPPPNATAYLRRVLGRSSARARRAAIEALAVMGGEDARAAVAAALADEERDVQLAAIRALGQLGHGAALSALLTTVEEPEIVAAAVSALSETDEERALEVCATLVLHRDEVIACAAVAALGRMGEARAEQGLARALEHPSDGVVKLALSQLARQHTARAVEALGGALDHGSWEVRRVAAELLGESSAPAAHASLRGRLEHESDATVREAIMLALAMSGADPA